MRLEDLQGRRLGRYEIIGLLGRGGMAAVYRAHDTALRRDVALKILYPQYSSDRTQIERFEREAVLAAGLDHANIVPIYDVGEANGLVYIAMKLLGGPSLADVLRSRSILPLDEVLPIIDQIAAALDYAHARNIVHRDIKAGNIILEGMGVGDWGSGATPSNSQLPTPDPHAVLTDFGIAKSLDPQASGLTGTGMLIGTPDYMAPEQIRSGQTVDWRADIYALGVLLFRCLTGRLPFEGGTEQVLLGHLYGTVPDPSMIEPSLPPSIDPVVRMALAREPAQRYQSAGALANALRAAARGRLAPVGPAVAGRAAVPTPDNLAWRHSAPDDATRKGDAAPPHRGGVYDGPTSGGAPPRGPAAPVAASEDRGGAGPIILAILLVLLVGGGLLAFVLWGGAGGITGGIPTPPAIAPATAVEPPTEPAALPTEAPAPTAEPTVAPTAPVEATPTNAPAPTQAPPATALPRPTATPAPTSPPTPTPTAEPTATPEPTNTSTPTPCPQPLVGGFGKLWNDNRQVRERIGCPVAAEQGGPSTIAEQPFERGSMFYYKPPLDVIYVLIGVDSGDWRLFPPTQLTPLPTPTPDPDPPCREPMQGGFSLVWGSFSEIREDLGCPTAPEDGLLEGAYQSFENGTMLFSQKGLGRGKTIYVLYDNGAFERYDDTNP
jgi:serine/threonine-protein kinase